MEEKEPGMKKKLTKRASKANHVDSDLFITIITLLLSPWLAFSNWSSKSVRRLASPLSGAVKRCANSFKADEFAHARNLRLVTPKSTFFGAVGRFVFEFSSLFRPLTPTLIAMAFRALVGHESTVRMRILNAFLLRTHFLRDEILRLLKMKIYCVQEFPFSGHQKSLKKCT